MKVQIQPDIFRSALNRINERGWGQGSESGGKFHCTVTAIYAAVGRGTQGAKAYIDYFGKTLCLPEGGVVRWNDAQGRTKADVVRAFETVIAICRAADPVFVDVQEESGRSAMSYESYEEFSLGFNITKEMLKKAEKVEKMAKAKMFIDCNPGLDHAADALWFKPPEWEVLKIPMYV